MLAILVISAALGWLAGSRPSVAIRAVASALVVVACAWSLISQGLSDGWLTAVLSLVGFNLTLWTSALMRRQADLHRADAPGMSGAIKREQGADVES